MAITVNWNTDQVIFVPKADTTLIQASPEVRELDADTFRKALKDLEASAEGIMYTDTHEHAGERTLSGVTYARFVEILPPYTVEFEDGQYAVSIVGANTNLIDVKVANQVSLLGNNSAGLVNLNNILSALNYQGAVWIDTVNGSAGTIQGTNGTPSNPSNNIADALTIAANLGVRELRFITGAVTLASSVEDFVVKLGANATLNFGSQSVNGTEFIGGTLTGTMTGTISATESFLSGISGFLGRAKRCGVAGVITLGSGFSSWHDCFSDVVGTGTPEVDFVGAGRTFSNRGYVGGISLSNLNDVSNVTSLDILSGQCILNASCSGGTAVVRDGLHPFTDNSTGTTVVSGINAERIWGALQSAFAAGSGTMGELLDDAAVKAALAAALSAAS